MVENRRTTFLRVQVYLLFRAIVVLGFFFSSQLSRGQVANDLIANRIALKIDQPFQSNTTNCRVEKECINEALTSKCIKYHNDQWFTIVPNSNQQYYLNIFNQSCRNLRGVQLVVIDGEPCEIADYQIITCVSLATQDDIFVQLDGLVIGKTYLLNVDGYLHDFCNFMIAFSTTPRGLPVSNNNNLLIYSNKNQYVQLNWEIEESQEADIIMYEVYRRSDKETKHTLIQNISHEKNAFGVARLAYSTCDTVKQSGTFYYKIVAVRNSDVPIILDEIEFRITIDGDSIEDTIELELNYEEKTQLAILVFDVEKGSLLKNYLFNFDSSHHKFLIDVHKWTNLGTSRFRVDIVDNSTDKKETLFFEK